MKNIILSHNSDVHARVVAARLADWKEEVAIVNTSLLEASPGLTIGWPSGEDPYLNIADLGRVWLADVSGIWTRRVWRAKSSLIVPEARNFAVEEWTIAIESLVALCGDRSMNDLISQRTCHKPIQLEVARKMGFSIPPTLVTSNPAELTNFEFEMMGESMVHKPLHHPDFQMLETRILNTEDKAFIGSIPLAPVIFQRAIPYVAEWRVTIVDANVFSARRDIHFDVNKPDTRLVIANRWLQATLDSNFEANLITLVRRLGLRFATCDILEDSTGALWFLEANPQGQFLFIEVDTGLPISWAVAAAISGRSEVSA